MTRSKPPQGTKIPPDSIVFRAIEDNEPNRVLLTNVHPPEWTNPKPSGMYDLVVLGAGPSGLTAATMAADKGLKVALIERDLIGGECLNIGCIPSKTLIRTSRLYADMRNAENFGGKVPPQIEVDFNAAMMRMRRIRAQISAHISVDRLRKRGIELYFGHGQFRDANSIIVDGAVLRFRKAMVATGSRPRIPDIPGLEQAGYLTNETVFALQTCPESLLVIGGGALGCELAQAFCRFGSRVTIVQDEPMFLNNVERDGAQILSDAMAADGVDIHLNTQVTSVRSEGGNKIVELASDDVKTTVVVKTILVGIGQAPNTQDLALECAGIRANEEGGIVVNDFMRSSNRRVYAVGDVSASEKLVHIPDAVVKAATRNAVFGGRDRIGESVVPWCIYTDPEIAHVGIQVREARQQNIPIKTVTILMHQVDRALADSEDVGFVKIHLREGTDTILGATIVSRHAGDIINGIVLAMSCGIGLKGLAKTNYPYPTQGDAIKMAANVYMRGFRPSLLGRLRGVLVRG